MDSLDSPLEVLSLAATMVQDRCLPPSYEEARRVLPSAEWRKERHARDRLPEYDSSKMKKNHGEAPLDMTTRRSEPDRGSPPSYTQSISQPGYRRSVPSGATLPPSWPSSKKSCARLASVEQAADSTQDLKKGNRKELITGSGTSDPDIDEHFRRSLGDVYQNVFCTSSKKDDSSSGKDIHEKSTSPAPTSGLSVDDHFAKALGETWLKLQAETSSPVPKATKESRGRGPAAIKTVNGLTVAFPVKSNKKDSNPSEITRQRRRGLVTS